LIKILPDKNKDLKFKREEVNELVLDLYAYLQNKGFREEDLCDEIMALLKEVVPESIVFYALF